MLHQITIDMPEEEQGRQVSPSTLQTQTGFRDPTQAPPTHPYPTPAHSTGLPFFDYRHLLPSPAFNHNSAVRPHSSTMVGQRQLVVPGSVPLPQPYLWGPAGVSPFTSCPPASPLNLETNAPLYHAPPVPPGVMSASAATRRSSPAPANGGFIQTHQHPTDYGHTTTVQHDIPLIDSKPFRLPYRKIPPSQWQDVRKMLTDMEAAGIIRPSKSPYASPVQRQTSQEDGNATDSEHEQQDIDNMEESDGEDVGESADCPDPISTGQAPVPLTSTGAETALYHKEKSCKETLSSKETFI
uniref:Uncharacterized protein n=1 Tax=Knipowitschia caucasica TaxID=637954 RepID=A0AAV2IQS2_KNICA